MITDKDKGYAALFKRLDGKLRTLSVGVHSEEGGASDGKLTVAEVATINEFGMGVPERSFIRAWADENQASNESALRAIGQAVVKGTFTADQGLDRAGLLFVGQIQARISSGIAPPNAPSTIARKGSSTPLINTGQLRSSILHKVQVGDRA